MLFLNFCYINVHVVHTYMYVYTCSTYIHVHVHTCMYMYTHICTWSWHLEWIQFAFVKLKGTNTKKINLTYKDILRRDYWTTSSDVSLTQLPYQPCCSNKFQAALPSDKVKSSKFTVTCDANHSFSLSVLNQLECISLCHEQQLS